MARGVYMAGYTWRGRRDGHFSGRYAPYWKSFLYYFKFQNSMRKNYEVEFPVFLDQMEKLLKRNNGGDEYFVGDEVAQAYIHT